jgi:hypothetical protein
LLIGQELELGGAYLTVPVSIRAVHARNWYFMRYGREDGLIADPRQFPLSALIFGERLVDPNSLTDKDFTDRAEFEFYSSLAGGGGTIKNIYSSIRASGVIPSGWKIAQNGLQKVKIGNQALLKQLQSAKPGKWVKVYAKGVDGTEYHWFQHESGAVFNVKRKY